MSGARERGSNRRCGVRPGGLVDIATRLTWSRPRRIATRMHNPNADSNGNLRRDHLDPTNAGNRLTRGHSDQTSSSRRSPHSSNLLFVSGGTTVTLLRTRRNGKPDDTVSHATASAAAMSCRQHIPRWTLVRCGWLSKAIHTGLEGSGSPVVCTESEKTVLQTGLPVPPSASHLLACATGDEADGDRWKRN